MGKGIRSCINRKLVSRGSCLEVKNQKTDQGKMEEQRENLFPEQSARIRKFLAQKEKI